ncbi:hypothetical protein D9M70_564410 [compost metagenome]
MMKLAMASSCEFSSLTMPATSLSVEAKPATLKLKPMTWPMPQDALCSAAVLSSCMAFSSRPYSPAPPM